MMGIDLYQILMTLPVLLLSLTLHEFAHARTALAYGDPTAKNMGRVTLNPLAHLDLVGTLVLVFTQRFGWAKPVPVNPMNLEPRRLGDVMVSLAGPMSNLGLALIAATIMKVGTTYYTQPSRFADTLYTVLWVTMQANLGLFMFNLLPLFPLDGHHIVREMLPADMQQGFMAWQMRVGRLVLMAIIMVPMLLPKIPSPLGYGLRHLFRALLRAFGLSVG